MTANLNIVPFVSVDHMMKLVLAIGVERFLTELAGYIEEDFRRWELFDKTPRIASHSMDGVIELMPTSDGQLYGFKYVNGHPKNTRDGLQTVTAFGVLADVGSGYPMLLSEMTILTALRTAATSALAAKYLAPKDARTHGDHRQWRAVGVPGARLQGAARHRQAAPLRHRCRAPRASCAKNLAGFGFDITICASAQEAVEGAEIITTVTADKQLGDDPDRQHGRRRRAHQRGRRRLPGQDRAAPRHPAALRHLRRISAADADRGRDPAARRRPSGHRALAGDRPARRQGRTRRPGRSRCSIRSASPSRIFRRCAMCATSCSEPGFTRNSTCSPIPTSRATCSACSCAPRRRLWPETAFLTW